MELLLCTGPYLGVSGAPTLGHTSENLSTNLKTTDFWTPFPRSSLFLFLFFFCMKSGLGPRTYLFKQPYQEIPLLFLG